MNLSEREKLALSLVKRAGRYLAGQFGKINSGTEKEFMEVVSEADITAERIIINAIQRKFPEDGILSEEREKQEGCPLYEWIIDPLDGTHNFLAGLREFSCGLALLKDGEVIFGVCYVPMYGEFFWAKKGQGAFRNGNKIEVSKTETFRGQVAFIDSAVRHAPEKILRDIERFAGVGCRVRCSGSAHFNLTSLACGRGAVSTNRGLKPWDIAPVAIILEEAGGKMTDEKGNPWQEVFLTSRFILATNGILHHEALELFR